jgi:regulatory protein
LSPERASELRARALRLLARREHSRAELARKLAPHAESAEALNRLLDDLQSRKQLCDERYAEERARTLSRKYGGARIRQDLRARGVADETARAFAAGSDAEEFLRAKAILERRYRTPAATPQERARRARFLHGRGFSYQVIHRLLSSRDGA